MDTAGKGKIRYVSGYVIAKLKHSLSGKIKNSLYVKGKQQQLKYHQNQMDILNSLCALYDELQISSCDPDTLHEIKRKQNQREGLTNISDLAFNFFQKLEILCRKRLTHENLVTVGKTMFTVVKEELLSDPDLYQSWLECVSNSFKTAPQSEQRDSIEELMFFLVMASENVLDLFKSVVNLFLKVSFSQFRRDYLAFLKKEKGKALRKKVMEKSKKVVKSFNMKFYNEDKSVNKQGSILRLKSELVQNDKYLNDCSFTKKELLLLCKDFKIKISAQKRKDEIAGLISKTILSSDIAYIPEESNTLDAEEPGPSGTTTRPLCSVSVPSGQPEKEIRTEKRQSKRKGKGKGRGKKRKTSEDSDDKCSVCNRSALEGEFWICCDYCSLWYHRDCVHLQDEQEWLRLTESGDPFSCPMCI